MVPPSQLEKIKNVHVKLFIGTLLLFVGTLVLGDFVQMKYFAETINTQAVRKKK